MLLNILYSLDSFLIISHVLIMYFKHFQVNTLKSYNILIQFLKQKLGILNIVYLLVTFYMLRINLTTLIVQ